MSNFKHTVTFFIDNTPEKIELLKRVLRKMHEEKVIDYNFHDREVEPGGWKYVDFHCNDTATIRMLGMYSVAVGLYDDASNHEGNWAQDFKNRLMNFSKEELEKIKI